MKEVRVFDVANEVLGIVSQRQPSSFVPFKGKFPLLPKCLAEDYGKEVASSKLLSETPIWVQDIINQALKIKRIEDGFIEYLKFNGIFKEFKDMDNADKSTELARFLDANCMSLEYLQID